MTQFRDQTLPTLILVCCIVIALWQIVTIPPTQNTLAYPGQATDTPVPAYPAPATSTPLSPNPNQPWPTPTPFSLTPVSTPRKGIAPSFNDDVYRTDYADWSYVWSAYGAEATQLEVPMLIGSIYEHSQPTRWHIVPGILGKHDGYLTVFNECEHNWQCDASPEEAADYFYQEVYRLLTTIEPGDLKVGLEPRLIIGGNNAYPCGIQWLSQFVTTYEARYGPLDDLVAGWHFHIYPDVYSDSQSNCNNWVNRASAVSNPQTTQAIVEDQLAGIRLFLYEYVWESGQPLDDEVWLTEVGCTYGSGNILPSGTREAGLTPQPGATFEPGCDYETNGYPLVYYMLSEFTGRLNEDWNWVDRYAWYSNWSDRFDYTLMYDITPVPEGTPQPTPNAQPTLTDLGLYYHQVTPAPAQPLPTPAYWGYTYFPVVKTSN